MTLGRMAAAYAALDAGLAVGDMWAQTNNQAQSKGNPGWAGRRACAAHVATLTVTQGAFLGVAVLATGERLSPRRVAVGLTLNAITHYFADRRTPLEKLAGKLAWMGKDEFYRIGQPPLATGARALDESWHIGCNAVIAAVIAGRTR